MALNQAIIQGRLCAGPALRQTQSGLPVVSFAVAVERDYKAEGSGKRETDFIQAVAWRKTAEFVNKYFGKGDPIIVSGRLQVRDYTDKNGNDRRAVEIVADHAYFAGAKKDGGEKRSDYDAGQSYSGSGGAFSELDDDDQDLPF
ncbi:MAG: single-stranded DNA-binding protein [Oscillospiraceae bacterium]|jgi:single-strand DNA-binding protein|nr:single-stranded DNA-binding protein [Oscillospiraceae bacterium]